MTRSKAAALLLLATVAATPTAQTATETATETETETETGIEDDVLTVAEVARLLRVTPENVIELAESGNIPARHIGEDWRFNRAAIMEWLQGERPLGVDELANLNGRSDSSRDPRTPARPIGEAPSAPTAEEVARRDQGVLLPRGSTTLEPSLSYSQQTRESIPILRVEQSTSTASLAVRYGILDDLQISAQILGIYRRTDIFSEDIITGIGITEKDTDSYFGDMSLSLQGVALRENIGRPSITWSIDTVLPTGPGDTGIGAGLVLSKTYDPVVIYTGVNYLYGTDTDRTDPRRVLAENNLSLNFGYTYAVNDSVAFSSALSGFYRSPPDSGTVIPLEKESYLLQLGMTWALTERLFIEPVVFVSIGGTAPDMNFVLSMPYTF